MATEISWLIEQIEVYPDVNGYKNVVFRCNWRANAVDGNYKSTVFGIEIIDFVEGGNFTEYNDLKSDQVIGWVDRKSTRLNSSHSQQSRMPSSA